MHSQSSIKFLDTSHIVILVTYFNTKQNKKTHRIVSNLISHLYSLLHPLEKLNSTCI